MHGGYNPTMRDFDTALHVYVNSPAAQSSTWYNDLSFRREGTVDILWLGDAASFDLALVGGKAANLSKLAARHRVPPGFCLTTSALNDGLNPDTGPDLAGWMRPTLYGRLSDAYDDL